MSKAVWKRVGLGVTAVVMAMSFVACNTKIKVSYDYKASDYVTLGQYKGITVSVDTEAIENSVIETKIKSDQTKNTEYTEVSRGIQNTDQVTMDLSATVGGSSVDGFTKSGYSLILGTDTFPIDGFTDAIMGMKAGDSKVIILTVPSNFSQDTSIAGKKIVFDVTVTKVEQANVPMITDAYVKEKLGYDSVEDYKAQLKSDNQSDIDSKIESAKKEAVLKQLQDNCTFTDDLPQTLVDDRTENLSTSISFYSTLYDETNDEYCQNTYGMSFDEYVNKAVKQELVLQAIADQEGLSITEYDYKGNLESFASQMGYSDKDSMVSKYGKDYIVKEMLLYKAQDIVMNSAVYN